MIKYAAKIENGVVKQIIAGGAVWATDKLGGDWIDATNKNVTIGFTYTEEEGFRPPKPHEMAYWDGNENRWIIPDEYLPPEPEDPDEI